MNTYFLVFFTKYKEFYRSFWPATTFVTYFIAVTNKMLAYLS